MSKQLEKLFARLEQEKFFGKVTLELKAGQLVLIREERTFLPEKSSLNGKPDANRNT